MYKKFWTCLKNEVGFSLPEIMVGGAILAGVALAGATIFRNQNKAQSKLEHDKILIQFHSKTAKLLASNQNCNVTLASAIGNSSVGPLPITQIQICNEALYPLQCASKNSEPGNYSGTPLITNGGYIDPGEVWSLASISFPQPRSTTGPFRIRMNYAKNPRLNATERVSKDIIVNVRFSGSQFRECFNDQESSINNLQSDICNTLTSVNSSGAISQWNDVTQSCVMNVDATNGIKNCPAGSQMIAGASQDGILRCRDLEEGPKNTAVDPTATTCPIGQKPSLEVVSTAGPLKGTVKVICIP